MEQIHQYYAITAIRPDAQKVVPVWDLPTDDRAKIGKTVMLKKSSNGRFGKQPKKFKQNGRKRGGDDTEAVLTENDSEVVLKENYPELITVMFWDNV